MAPPTRLARRKPICVRVDRISSVATSSATSMRQALMAISCVALAKAPMAASRLNQASAEAGSSWLITTSAAPMISCIGAIHCLRLPSLRTPGISTLSSSGDHRNWKA